MTLSSPFSVHIFDIFGLSSSPKMVRTNARRIVSIRTIMKGFISFRKWPFMKFIGETMSSYFMTIDSQSSITKSCSANPEPTSRSLFDINPKTSNWVHPASTAETTEAGNGFTTLFADKIARIFSHLKFLSGVIAPVINVTRSFFTVSIITQGMVI